MDSPSHANPSGGEESLNVVSSAIAPAHKPSHSPFQRFWRGLGWVSYSFSYAIFTGLYSAIYPKILESLCASRRTYNQLFSAVNFVTLALSSILLPPIGSVVDQLHVIKRHMILAMILVVILSFCVFAVGKFPALYPAMAGLLSFQRWTNCLLYIVLMFVLRYGGMTNNALLACFEAREMNVLSLVGNFGGFGTMFLGLVLMKLLPSHYFIPDGTWDLSPAYWWLLIGTTIAFSFVWVFFFSPSDVPAEDDEDEGSGSQWCECGVILKDSCCSLWETVRRACSNPEYRRCWLFLFAYLFYSTSGTAFTIFVTQVYISVFQLSLDDVVKLNIFFAVFLVLGVVLGIALDRLFHHCRNLTFQQSILIDLGVLFIQNILFLGLFLLLFLLITLETGYLWSLLVAMNIGLLYSWNASVSRTVMTKLIPPSKKAEFMAYYSSFMHLGIAIVSGLNIIANALTKKNAPQVVFLLLMLFALPSFLFFFLLVRNICKSSLDSFSSQKNLSAYEGPYERISESSQ